jgi:hypothetical protein
LLPATIFTQAPPLLPATWVVNSDALLSALLMLLAEGSWEALDWSGACCVLTASAGCTGSAAWLLQALVHVLRCCSGTIKAPAAPGM